MSIESAKKFVKKIQENDDFAKSFFACASSEERKIFIKENGFEFTKEEINEVKEGITVAGGTCCGHTHEHSSCDENYPCYI